MTDDRGARPAHKGVHHVSITVTDVEASAAWYQMVFGAERVPVTFPHFGAEESGYTVLLLEPTTGFALGLHHNTATKASPLTRAGPAWTTSHSPLLTVRISTPGPSG